MDSQKCEKIYIIKKGVFSMNLKKIGSMLTSIAMIASLATYVPSVSASYKLDSSIETSDTGTGASVALNQADFDKVLKAGSYEGTFYGNPDVSYVLDVTNSETNGVTYKSAVLTIKPTTEGEEYTIPQSDVDTKGILDLIAYDLDYDSANLNVLIDEYVIEGNCTGYANNAFAEVSRDSFTPKFTYSCLADADFSGLASKFELNLTHNYKANAGRKNHTCEDCGIISKDFKVHDFKVASTTSKVHTCDCGATSEDFPQIHEWEDSTHKCKLCGLDNADAHTKVITSTATTHTVKCADCGMTLAAAENHEWAVATEKVTFSDEITIDAHSHYCTVCGYVAGTNKEDARHSYSNIYVNEKQSDGTWEKVLTPVATGGMVCACGAIDPSHTHTFEAKNGAHMCQCGELESITSNTHAYNYTFTGKGLYTVNGLAGFDFSQGNGAVCGCGAINSSAHTHVTVADVKAGTKNGVLFNKQHYCECGQLIVDDNGDPVHNYVADEKTHQHKCVCGAVDENAHVYEYKYTFSAVSDTTTILNTYSAERNETAIAVQAAQGLTKTKVTDGTGLVCDCGAIKESHKKCDYTKADMCDTENHIHYCACGSSSTDESVHDIDAKTNMCKLCGAYKTHDHEVVNCVCTICGESVHDYAVVTYKGQKVHQCQDCGAIVYASATEDPAHEFVAKNGQHICECGAVSDKHVYGTEGEAQCICQECGYENHVPAYDSTKKAHYCENCEKTFADGEVCEYSNETDKCECGYLNPMHKHAVAKLATDAKGNDSCRCGQIIAFDWELKDKSDHINKNAVQTVEKSDSGIQTVTTKEDAEKSTLTAGHSFDANGFCVCGAVDTKVTAKAKSVNISDLSKSYSSSYLVSLGKAASAVAAYDITDAGTVGANVSVAKTADEQAEFTKLLAEFNEVYAEMDDNKATTGYTVSVVGEGGYIGEGTDVAETKTILAPFGEEVELVATAKAGYKFAGWYTDEACTTLWAADATTSPYAVKVQNGVTNIYAKFVTQGNFTINIPGGVTVKSTITNTAEDGTTKTRDADYKFVVGEEVTLTVPAAAENETLIGLVNGWGQICELNAKNEYTFTVSSNMSNSFAVKSFANSAQGATSIYVVFKNESQILAQDEITLTNGSADVTSIVPNDQVKNGYTFKGWADSTDSTKVVRLKSITKDTVFVPVFEKIKGYTLTFGEGGRFAKNDDLKTNNEDGFEYGASVAITAEPMLNGKYFSGWYTEDGTLVSYKKDTMYVITGSAKLVPEYNGDSELVAESMTTFTRTDRVKTSSGQQFVATANWEMEPGVTVLEAGFVFSFTGKTGEALSVENADNKDVYKRVSTDKSANGTYDFTFSLSSKSGRDMSTVNLKSFVTYVDASGETHTIYSVTEDAVKPLA